jgi:hypothetical protein
MPDFTRRVKKKLVLPDGEVVQKAVVAQPPKSMSRNISEGRTVYGAVSDTLLNSLVGESNDQSSRQTAMAGRVPTSNGYLVVTNMRLLWADQTRMAAVGEIKAKFDFADIASVGVEKGGGTGNRLLSITFADSSSIDLAVMKSQHPENIATVIQSHLAQG